MPMNTKWILAALLLGFATMPAQAQAGLSLGKPGYGGPGCPGGSAAVALGNGGRTLSLRFSDYQVRAGTGGRSFDRKSCNLTIPIRVPAGKALFVTGFDYKGRTRLPAGGEASFNVEYFFPGGEGPKFSRTFRGPRNGPFTVSQTLVGSSVVRSACGASTNLRVNTSLKVDAGRGETAASIRRADVNAALVYRLELRNC